MTTTIYVTKEELAAYKAEVNERFSNFMIQLQALNTKIAALQATQSIASFPDENEQIRTKVLTAFDQEIATLTADILKLKSDVVDLQEETGIV